MSGISWAGTGVSGSWSNGALWNGGIAPGAADQVTIAAGGQYAVTISGVAQVAALTLNAAGGELYDSGSLTVSSVFALDAGTLALAGGGLSGGTLALAGGVLQADGGSLANIAVDGTLNLSAQYADLFLRQGVSFAGANGSGAGSILLTGGYAQLDAVGSQSIADTVISFGTVNGGGASGGESALGVSDPGGAITPSTLTLTSTSWIRQTAGRGLIYAGAMNGLPGSSLPDEILNQGTIALSGGTISVQGNGVFANAGMIAISNGADFSVNSGGFSNSGSITVSGATLSFGGDFAASRLSALGNVTFSSGTLSITGTANNAGGTLSLGSGGNVVGPVMLSGTIAGGTVIDAGGGLLLSSGAGVLDDVIYRGTLVLAAGNTVTLRDSSAFENLAGSGNGSIAVTGIGSDLSLQGTTTLNNATISLGASGGEAVIGTLDGFLASSGTTATLGAGLVINQTGQDAQIMANGSTALVGVGFADSLINQGTINAGLVGGNMILGGVGYFGNSGTIAVTGGDILAVSVASFANSGLLAVGNGGVVELGKGGGFFSAGDVFTNTGTIALNAGTLVLAGVASTAALGRITASNGGTVIVSGNLENAGSTLSLGAGGVLPNLSLAGTISGGVISDPSHLLSIGFLGAADLNGVTYNGTLALAAGNFLRVQNGITVGAVTVASAGAVLDFQGTQDFNNAVVTLGNSASAAAIDFSHANSSGQATTLTLGNLLDITQSGAMAVVGGGDTVAGDMLINTGTITGAVAGGTLSLGGPDFDNQGFITVSNGDTLAITTPDFSNSGDISLQHAVLALGGTLNLASLSNINFNSSTIAVSGELNCSGGTLAIGSGSAYGQVALTGTLQGGVIADSGMGLVAGGGADLSDVTYQGTLNLSRPLSDLTISNGIAFAGVGGSGAGEILLTGAGDQLICSTSETLSNATILAGNQGSYYQNLHIGSPSIDAAAGTTLTLGASVMYRTAGLVAGLGNAAAGHWTDTIVNQGDILAGVTNGVLTIGSSIFVNEGGINIGQGADVAITCASFSNAGTISLVAGSWINLQLYNFYAAPNAPASPFSNGGTLRMLGGAFGEATAGGIFPAVAILNQAGGVIDGVGSINAEIANSGLIEAQYGALYLQQAISGNGTLAIVAGTGSQINTLVVDAAVSAGTMNFTGANEVLSLADAGQFGASISGFGAGDTIMLSHDVVTGLGVAGNQLTLSTAGGVDTLTFAGNITGAIGVGNDGHGDALVTIIPANVGGGAASVAASQSGMLFYAGGGGDIFTGTAAQLNNDQIANFGSLDKLDITDMAPGATLHFSQGLGVASLTITEGSVSVLVELTGSFTGSHFSLAADGHGGSLLSYSGG